MKKLLKILGVVLIVLIVAVGSAGFYMTRGLESGKKLVINPIKVSEMNDGIYHGKYNGGRWSNEVNVTVVDKKITNIEVTKDILIAVPEATSELTSRVIQKQNTDIDIVSGATVTSKAYLKAIENAMLQ